MIKIFIIQINIVAIKDIIHCLFSYLVKWVSKRKNERKKCNKKGNIALKFISFEMLEYKKNCLNPLEINKVRNFFVVAEELKLARKFNF